MAGSQDASENPVGINVVPMVDVIFCLCVFFMCSMKFKELEGKFQSWLPQDKGAQPGPMDPIEEIRVAIFWDEATHTVRRVFGRNTIRDDDHLQGLIKAAYEDCKRLGKNSPVIVDAAETVPWKAVVNVINLAKREGVEKIEFAAGRDYEAKK